MSTDNSVNLAKELGCNVISWSSNGIEDNKYIKIKENCWKYITNGWVICADMDEWLCISDEELLAEYLNGTTIIKIKGINIVGQSNSLLLDDVNLHSMHDGFYFPPESKKICFFVPEIKYVHYNSGAHLARFTGNIKYSKNIYINKHMEYLGLNYYLNKKKNRNSRMILKNYTNFYMKYINHHYTKNINIHKNRYLSKLSKSKNMFIDQEKNDKNLIREFIKKFINLF